MDRLIALFIFWLACSTVVSIWKADNGYCHNEYPVEKFFHANLFCPKE